MKIPDLDDPILSASSYLEFEKICVRFDPDKNAEKLLQKGLSFALETKQVDEVVDQYKRNISSFPLLSLILLWAQVVIKEKILKTYKLELMQQLIEKQLLPIQNEKSLLITLKDYIHLGHEAIIDNIRCHKDWSIKRREDVVLFYMSFATWISENSFGYIPSVVDPDRKIAARRRVPFEKYVELIDHLPERERILTKLYYLGGERAMDEVLSLKVSDIDFEKQQILFGDHFVRYAKHVLQDLKALIEGRRKGFVFVKKKNNEKINTTVPYRALKKAISDLNLPSSFSYRDLVKEL